MSAAEGAGGAGAGTSQPLSTAAKEAREAEVYDRQIRLWGVEAQRRLAKSRVLIAGMDALACEVCKNIVLSGINVTVQDTAVVSEEDLAAQFFLTAADVGKNRAARSLPFIKQLNPLATAACVETPLAEVSPAFWDDFCLVIMSGREPLATQVATDKLCREKGMQLMIARTCGLYSYMFCNLNAHTFQASAPAGKAPLAPETIEYPTLQQCLDAEWAPLIKSRLRRPPPMFFAFQLLFALEAKGADNLSEEQITTQAAALSASHGVDTGVIDTALVSTLVRCRDASVTPVCAVMGGMIAQEVVKAISRKDEPLCNVLCFDGTSGDGTVVRCG